jgi:hypothetical protein
VASPTETIDKILADSLINAIDNVNRARAQQQRMPYDHGNNDFLERARKWMEEVQAAINYNRSNKC